MSETTNDTPVETPPEQTTETETVDVEALQKELEKWKHFSRQNEDKYKEVNSKLEELQQANMTDAERAIAEAEARGRTAAEQEFRDKQSRLELENAAIKAGVPDHLLGLLDANKLVVNGEIQSDLLSSLAAPKTPQFTKSASDLGLGAQTSSSSDQWTREQLARANAAGDYDAINKARDEGKLNDIMTNSRS